ncbi:MAG TPA: hypothetical protein DIW17_17150 [Clostridiales bacterium]|nr:hypothetical protein [Clostridiales bacterium]
MKKMLAMLISAVFALVSLSGCQMNTNKVSQLTEDELAYFNGNSFFTNEYESSLVTVNIRNQFLSSLYDKPENIDLLELFYSGTGTIEDISEEEINAAMSAQGIEGSAEALPTGYHKTSRASMDKVLTDHMGISLEDSAKIGLEKFVFLPEYDAYYHLHGDTNYRMQIHFTKGEQIGDLIKLYYDDDFYGDGEKVLTLKKKDGGYLFISNQKIGK